MGNFYAASALTCTLLRSEWYLILFCAGATIKMGKIYAGEKKTWVIFTQD